MRKVSRDSPTQPPYNLSFKYTTMAKLDSTPMGSGKSFKLIPCVVVSSRLCKTMFLISLSPIDESIEEVYETWSVVDLAVDTPFRFKREL